MNDEQILYKKIAERIALLEFLGKVPIPPSRRPYKRPADESTGYSLDLRAERHLTSTLAFLSSIKDDQLKITAVCVREVTDGLEVLVAVNAKCTSESEYLECVGKGFRGIFNVLRKATITNRSVLKQQGMNAIVTMCYSRIMSRARLQKSEDKSRFNDQIDEIVDRFRGIKSLQNKAPFLKSLGRLSQLLRNNIDVAGTGGSHSENTHPALLEIIDECCALSTISNWKSLVHKASELNAVRKDLFLSTCQSVVNMVEKLAQYSVAAQTLVDAARRYSIVRDATVVVVRLEKDAFAAFPDAGGSAPTTARQVFSTVAGPHRSNINFDTLRTKICAKEKAANKTYQMSLTNALQHSRIHAEMQLIWYLDSHPNCRPTRVIASHKDACYLCNAFMNFHGLYTVPRSHGRLYPNWRLPAVGMKQSREGFARELERLFIIRADEILSGSRKLSDPRESRLNSTVTSLATIVTVDEEEQVGGSTSDAETIKPEDFDPKSSSEVSSDVGVAEDTAVIAELGVSRVDFAGVTPPTAATGPIERAQSENDALWRTVEQGQSIALRLTPKLRVHVEYSATDPLRKLSLKTSELSPTEMADMDASGAEKVYDVHRDLPLWQDVLCGANCRFVCLQVNSLGQQRARRFRVELG